LSDAGLRRRGLSRSDYASFAPPELTRSLGGIRPLGARR